MRPAGPIQGVRFDPFRLVIGEHLSVLSDLSPCQQLPQTVGRPGAGSVQRVFELVRGVRPGRQDLRGLTIVGHGGDPVRRAEFAQVFHEDVEDPVPVALNREEIIDENQKVRAHRSVRIEAGYSGEISGRSAPGETVLDLREVGDRRR